MKRFLTLMSLLVLVGCVQDSPNVKQIANLKFFIENQEQEGINVVEKGLHYAVLNYGDMNSKSPELSDTITAHFHGTLTDGTVFWSSVDSNEPLTIELSKLIEGCQKIISLMKINDKWRVYIEGINVVEKGLHYAVLNYGDMNSKSPELSDTITAHFHGTLTDGTVFWSSVDSNEPLTIELSKLIEGCQKIISLMKINDKWRVYIDPSMAYGDEGRPGIPSNSILIFDIELLDIQ